MRDRKVGPFENALEYIPAGYFLDVFGRGLWYQGRVYLCKLECEYDTARLVELVYAQYAGQRIEGSLQEVVDQVCAMHRLGVE